MRTIACVVIVLMVAGTAVYAEGEKLGKDDFVSTAISDVFDKVGQYTSGQKRLMEPVEEEGRQEAGYTTDALGRRIPDTSVPAGPITRPDKKQ